jgi:hypothetical protein
LQELLFRRFVGAGHPGVDHDLSLPVIDLDDGALRRATVKVPEAAASWGNSLQVRSS